MIQWCRPFPLLAHLPIQTSAIFHFLLIFCDTSISQMSFFLSKPNWELSFTITTHSQELSKKRISDVVSMIRTKQRKVSLALYGMKLLKFWLADPDSDSSQGRNFFIFFGSGSSQKGRLRAAPAPKLSSVHSKYNHFIHFIHLTILSLLFWIMKLPYEPSCPLVGWMVCRSV